MLTSGSEVASFTYDSSGRRASKTAGGVTQNFVYEGDQILEVRGSGTTVRHIQGIQVDEHLATVIGSTPTYLVANHLGSIVQETDQSGAVTLTRRYDPYGKLLEGAAVSGYAFTGREWDSETGLYYYRARYYDPAIGRFISEDPSETLSFSYVENRPTTFVDPSGLIYARPPIVTEHVVEQSQVPDGAVAASNAKSGVACQCDKCPDGQYSLTMILIVEVEMWLPTKVTRTPAVDKTVTTTDTARAQEFSWHITPATSAALADPAAKKAEGQSYKSEKECTSACQGAGKKVVNTFIRTLRATKADEDRRAKGGR